MGNKNVRGPISSERAKRILEENPNMHFFHKEKYFAAIHGTMPEYYLQRFFNYRYNYSDDLPEPDVDLSHKDYSFLKLKAGWDHPAAPKLKCYRNVIGGIGLSLKSVLQYEIILGDEMEQLVGDYHCYEFEAKKAEKGKAWTSQKDIDFMNNSLDKVIRFMEKKYFE